jgi:hypothetical protein
MVARSLCSRETRGAWRGACGRHRGYACAERVFCGSGRSPSVTHVVTDIDGDAFSELWLNTI